MEILIYKSIIITLSIIAAFVAFKGFFCVLRMLEKYNAIFNKKTLLKEANIQAQHIKKMQNKSINEQISLLQEDLYEHLETTKQEIEAQQEQIEEKKLSLDQEYKKITDFENSFDSKKLDLLEKSKIITKLKEILAEEKDTQYEIQGVYGVYDIVLKLTSDDIDTLRSTITNKIRKITSVQSTLTMMVIEEQEKA